MYRHLLIPTDGSETAAAAVQAGIALASECGAKVTFFTAMPRYRRPDDEDPRYGGVLPVDEHHRRTQDLENDLPYQGIIDAAELKQCDLIVMSSHRRRRVAALLYGSETRAVLTHSRIPTLVYRADLKEG